MYWNFARFKYKHMFMSGHFRVLSIWKSHFQCNANWRFQQHPHLLHVLFVKVAPGTIYTSWSKHHFVVIAKAEQQVRKASHSCTKQKWRSHVVIILFLLVCATRVCSSCTSSSRWIAHSTQRWEAATAEKGWARLFEMTESERDK